MDFYILFYFGRLLERYIEIFPTLSSKDLGESIRYKTRLFAENIILKNNINVRIQARFLNALKKGNLLISDAIDILFIFHALSTSFHVSFISYFT